MQEVVYQQRQKTGHPARSRKVCFSKKKVFVGVVSCSWAALPESDGPVSKIYQK